MTKNFVPALLLVFILLLGVGAAYFSRNPESPWLEKAEAWPVIGEVATYFREAYLGPRTDLGPPPEVEDESDTVYEFVDGTLRPAGRQPARPSVRSTPPPRRSQPETRRPSRQIEAQPVVITDRDGTVPGFSPVREVPPQRLALPQIADDWQWFMPGQPLVAEPGSGAEAIAELQGIAWLPVLARDGFWAQVRHRGSSAWIDTSWTPPYSRRDARQGGIRRKVQPPRRSAWSQLEKAQDHMGLKRANGKLGAYNLYTDVEDADLLDFLDSVATAAEDAYFARLGRLPSGDPLRTAVLFADESDYRQYSSDANLPTSTHVGHAGSGVLAFYVGPFERKQLARTLVHEITHLLNKRALAWDLPPWLEEGLASDMGNLWFEDDRDLAQANQSMDAYVRGRQAQDRALHGLDIDLLFLDALRRSGRLPSVGAIVVADRETFFSKIGPRIGYAYGAALVRYLLDADYAGSFRHFLGQIADGYGPNAALLVDSLGFEDRVDEGLMAIDHGFRIWLAANAARASKDLSERHGIDEVRFDTGG